MAKALLDTIRQVESAAQTELEAAHAQAERMEEEAKTAAAQFAAASAKDDAEQTERSFSAAQAEIGQMRENILQDYRMQANELSVAAEQRMPQAVDCILAALTGK